MDYWRFQGLIGVVVLLGLAWLISEHRRRIDWRLVGGGLLLQVVLAVVLLKVPGPATAVEWLSYGVAGVIARADAGIAFVFSRQLIEPGTPWGFIFAVRVLPVIIFFASLMSVLYYLGLMQRVVAGLAWVLRRTLGVTGAEALAMASNVFVGQTEAPLCVRPLLEKMTRAQLMTLMVGGFATIAGSVLAAYVAYLAPDAAVGASLEEVKAAMDHKAMWIKHLITASVMSAPAAFVLARVIVPETEEPPAEHVEAFKSEDPPANLFDAAAIGATDGLKLALNVAGMLIAFVSLVALVSWPLEALGEWGPVHEWLAGQGIETLNLEVVLGWLFAPLAWTMGVPWDESAFFGTLMGEKVVVTEFVAFKDLALDVNSASPKLSERSAILAAYALCGFANFASIGIQIGGLSALAPGRRKQFVQLAFKAMIGGAFASWITASLVGVLL